MKKRSAHLRAASPAHHSQQWNCRTSYLYWDQKACTLINQTLAEMTHWTLHPHIRRMSTRLQQITYTTPLLLTQEHHRSHFEHTFKQGKPDKTQQHGLRSMEPETEIFWGTEKSHNNCWSPKGLKDLYKSLLITIQESWICEEDWGANVPSVKPTKLGCAWGS